MGATIITPEQEKRIIELYPTHTTYEIAAILGLNRSTVKNRVYGLKLKKAEGNTKTGRFSKGHKSWNDGMKGLQIGGKETQFRKGNLPHNTKTDGAITVRFDKRSGRSYLFIRTSLGKWKHLHVHVWEQHNGKALKGHIVIFIDGDTMNCDINNLKMISRSEHSNNTRNSPGYIAATMSRIEGGRGMYDQDLQQELMKHPDLIEARRQQLKLNQTIKRHEKAD